MNWNAYVNVKGSGKINESAWNEIKKWAEVEQVWTCSGEWDWLVKLKPAVDNWEKAKKFITMLRDHAWISQTSTWWAQAL